MNTLFLDFDGVLFDTAKEAYLLSEYAYSEITPFENIDKDKFKTFYEHKYLVTNSWQYYFLMQSIESRQDIEMYFLSNAIPNKQSSDFDIKFQQCRQDLINNHFDYWNSLDEPYPFFFEIKNLSKQFNIVIVSTKNAQAIKNKLQQYLFNVKDENIIGKEILKEFSSKGEFISKYIIDKNIAHGIFVDDSINNIETCKNILNLNAYLANWGYCNPKFEGKNCQEIVNLIKESL